MIYAVKGLAVLFAVLHIAAAASARGRNRDTGVLMSAGAGIMAVSAILPAFDWLAALLGGAGVCAAAVVNGKRQGKINWSHHAVRGAVAAVVLGYVIW